MEAKVLRSRARAVLAGHWGISVGVAALAALLGGLLTGSSFLPNISYQIPIRIPVLEELSALLREGARMGRFTFSIRSGVFGLAAFILGGTLQLGYARFLLKQHDGQEAEFNDLFSQFDRFGTGFAQHFLRSLYVALWSILLVIPGIMKHYSYAMTPFILAEHPELTASEAIERSKEMMSGNRFRLFCLHISFIGWAVLCAFTFGIGNLWLTPYRQASVAAFYREVSGTERM